MSLFEFCVCVQYRKSFFNIYILLPPLGTANKLYESRSSKRFVSTYFCQLLFASSSQRLSTSSNQSSSWYSFLSGIIHSSQAFLIIYQFCNHSVICYANYIHQSPDRWIQEILLCLRHFPIHLFLSYFISYTHL